MREHKYRAWDGEYRLMYYLNSGGRTFGIHSGNSAFDWQWLMYGHRDRYELMQYTGLKDKNGKALDWWESDLFEIDCTWPVYVLEYNETAGAFGLRGNGGMWKSFPDTYRDYGDDSIHKIGNRFENPELMGGKG